MFNLGKVLGRKNLFRLGKNKPHELGGVQFFKRFSAQFVKFSAKFGSLNVQIRKTSEISSSYPVNEAKYVNTM